MTSRQGNKTGRHNNGIRLFVALRRLRQLALRNLIAVMCLSAVAACSAKQPELETSAGCFTVIAFSSEPLYFPTDLKRWERALEKNFDRPAIFEKIDMIIAKLDELEDSTAHLKKMGQNCADVLNKLEAFDA